MAWASIAVQCLQLHVRHATGLATRAGRHSAALLENDTIACTQSTSYSSTRRKQYSRARTRHSVVSTLNEKYGEKSQTQTSRLQMHMLSSLSAFTILLHRRHYECAIVYLSSHQRRCIIASANTGSCISLDFRRREKSQAHTVEGST